jgi:hypothetical protein
MRWVRRQFRKEAVERQLDAELRFHIEQQTSDYIAEGMNPTEARPSRIRRRRTCQRRVRGHPLGNSRR